jgi:uncharacterized protein YbjT (DUF2867 family)
MRVVITTPTGTIGRLVLEHLFRQGYPPIVIHRDPARVESLVRRGARLVRGSLDDPDVIATACQGADAVLWVSPANPLTTYVVDQCRRFAEAAETAFRRTGPIRVVNISSCGARNSSGVGPAKGLHIVEEALNRSLKDVTHLRAGYYFENFLIHPLLDKGRFSLPVPGNTQVPMVANRDIATIATRILLDRAWSGLRYLGVDGPELLSFEDAAAALSRGLGRRIAFETLRPAVAAATLRAQGIHRDSVLDILEFYAAVATGKFRFEEPRILTAPKPTDLETFARETLKPRLTA